MENHCSPPRSRPLSSDSSCCLQISSPDPDPISIPPENWVLAEDTVRDVILRGIQPMREADLKRRDVIDYVQRLIRSSLGYEVFPYGSVPLKTYLPDGDIDLTALHNSKPDDALALVRAVLEAEQHNHGVEFEVNDVQFIDAEVKLVKCLVQNIVVDISFNQLGGLCTLCFLEQVDRFIGKDHLFKRSIILIKAWCYYESRILGAHHGLISTYALETLVLYIFHTFHSSLNGPMVVLYRFLDYFGSFDWDNYCVSLCGPVSKSSLPDIVAEISDNGGCDALLSDEFLKNCVDMFTVPSRGLEENSRIFSQKHLNIIDPLKGNNNLGRSVHRGNYCRIRSAFRYGARKLGWILDLPRDRIADELHKFFTNTLERSRSESKFWDDMSISGLNFHGVGSSILSSSSFTTTLSGGNLNLLFGFSDDSNNLGLEPDSPANGDIIGEFNVEGIGNDPLTYDFLNSRVGKRVFDSSDSHNISISSFLEKSDAVDQTSLPAFATENDTSDNGHLKSINCYDLEDFDCESSRDSKENQSMHCDSICLCGTPTAGVTGSAEEHDSALDLSGDYDSHVRSLLYGQRCHGHDLSAPSLPTPPVSPSRVRKNNPWEHVRRSSHFGRNMEFQQDVDSTTIRPPLYPLNHPPITHIAFNSDMKQKLRGTGTFFPKLNCRTNKDRPVFGRKRNQTGVSHWQCRGHTYKNGLTKFHQGTNSFEECSNDVVLAQFSAQEQVHTKGVTKSLEVRSLSHECSLEMTQARFPLLCHSKCGSSADYHQTHPSLNGFSNTNGSVDDPFDKLEFGSIKRWLLGASLTEGSNHAAFDSPCAEVSTPNGAAEAVEWSPRAVSDDDSSRVAVEQFQLRNEGDFPPLAV